MITANKLDAAQKGKLLLCYNALADKKAEDVVILDIRGISTIADFFFICSGNSSTQVEAISDNLEKLLRDSGHKRYHVEGKGDSTWILVDAGEIIVHIFHKETREFYALENLWVDASRVDSNDIEKWK